jgi:hypothetical protein
LVYLLSHMGIMPLVDFFGTACEWLPRGSNAPTGLGWFLAASFFNGIVIEIGRKLRQPDAEEEGVETYSRLWGKSGGSIVWVAALGMTLVCAAMAASAIGFAGPLIAALVGMLGLALCAIVSYAKGTVPGKKIEAVTALWTLTLYLMLGLVPLLLRR